MAGLIEVAPQENVAKINAIITAKDIMDAYPSRSFHVTIAKFYNDEVHLPSHQEIGEVANAPDEIVHVEDKRLSYPPGATETKHDSSVSAIHHKPTPDCLQQMTEHEPVGENDEAILKKDWTDAVRLPASFMETYRPL